MNIEFKEFPKMPRLSRNITVTEKIDGTNASVYINEDATEIIAGSRNRWITPEDDNYGFAKWVQSNKEELLKLGHGHHFGEWWGQGIQRGYGINEKRFSLFNTFRWNEETTPKCCYVVPVLYKGEFDTNKIEEILLKLKDTGSLASPLFMKPEGIIVFHTAANIGFKKTIEKDEVPKSLQNM